MCNETNGWTLQIQIPLQVNITFLQLPFEWHYCGRYGGAYQYVKWANRTSILDFYREPCVGWYQNNVKTIVTRNNSITGVISSLNPPTYSTLLLFILYPIMA